MIDQMTLHPPSHHPQQKIQDFSEPVVFINSLS